MSSYIFALVRSKWHKEDGWEKKNAYARECLERFKLYYIGDKPAVESQEYEIGNTKCEDYMTEDRGIWGINYDRDDDCISIRLECKSMSAELDLYDGLWIIDAFYDDYMLTSMSDSGNFFVFEDYKEISAILDEKEAWIFTSPGLYEFPDDALPSFEKWLINAERTGVKELTKDILKEFYDMRHKKRLMGFEFSEYYNHTSKIYHLTF